MTYLKGSDIKQKGDCLCHCFIKKIESIGHNHLVGIKPKEFEKW